MSARLLDVNVLVSLLDSAHVHLPALLSASAGAWQLSVEALRGACPGCKG
jgi:hypothetical protein